ncbi:TPA: hypothetical protein QCD44_004238 [Enterobacter hormaechei]|uniref:hypothetical protein n=1 Tax=Duffyella gerundensis TaxID=1619313 RepID=UPI001653F090|nr:hypothetical protein [Duffyella gerundensis]HBM2521613.1 hypothetical protein [Enterobacter hormaechei]HBM2532054.1 hypothetical protein [Enterobacter hormaechei]HBM2648402.1 hypothetical protein [Enterobacter hormaechei]HDR1966948.1 hypothetical protein [Enterobacter hormaechei]HDR1970060.1 hypothetical protein [Enterobacter hormaechei]
MAETAIKLFPGSVPTDAGVKTMTEKEKQEKLTRVREKLAQDMASPLPAGYRTYTGYALKHWEAAAYNRYTEEAAKLGNSLEATEFYLDQRHKYFVLCSEEI